MAAKKRAGRKKRRWGWKIALALVLLLMAALLALCAAARVVHVRYATVYLRDLPPAFEGTTLLFVSDIDAHSAADARAAAKMMEALSALEPDILLLGGDYAAPGFWQTLNGMDMENAAVAAQAAADRYSARPGHSEHQSGLAMDVGAIDNNYGQTPAGQWLNAHCAEYGFILRYPQGKESITGYMYEPWHIRYVGSAAAEAIMANGLTLEEYLGVA